MINDAKQLIVAEDFDAKEKIIAELNDNYKNDKQYSLLLNKLLEGALYFNLSNNSLVYLGNPESDNPEIFDFETSQNISNLSFDSIDKISINNQIRSQIRSILTTINLSSEDYDKRYKAAKNIIENLDNDLLLTLSGFYSKENDQKIKQLLGESISILEAKNTSGDTQLKAIDKLGDCLSPQAYETLQGLQNTDDKILLSTINASIKKIEDNRKIYSIVETAYFGLSAGSVLLLAAIGLAITFGVMKVINMAHGELMMLGAYTTYTVQQIWPNLIEYSVIISIPLAFLVSAMVGIIIERLILRHLYGRPLEALLATFGVSLVLQQLVRTIYSPLNQEVKTPSWMSGALEINSALSLTYNRLYIIIFSLIVFLFVLYIMKKTYLGLKVRAVSQNRNIAKAMGIKTDWIDALTFGIGSGIAGVAGVALSQLTNVGPNLGQAYIVDSFMVVVFGGVGNLWGTLIAALSLGEINKFIEPIAGAVLAKVIILVLIILFIQKRPRGLFPQKGRDAED